MLLVLPLMRIPACTVGGIGTVLELFYTWQLIQVQHIHERPIVLLDRSFWVPLMQVSRYRCRFCICVVSPVFTHLPSLECTL